MNIATPDNAVSDRIAVISITPNGNRLARRLAELTPCDCYTNDRLMQDGFLPLDGGFSDGVAQLFNRYSRLLFICATGIVVRTIAPLVVSKLSDPAILVMDEQSKHIISLLSGHVGGANRLTLELAELLGADPVITTATDVNQVAALDMIAKAIDADIVDYRNSVKMINHMLVSGKRVGLYQQHAQADDTRGFIIVDDFEQLPQLDALVWIGISDTLPEFNFPVVQVVPRRVVAGIGCRRNTPCDDVHRLLMQQLKQNRLHPLALKAIGSIDVKRDEAGLNQLAQRLGVPFQTYSAQELALHQHRFPASEFVKQTVGVGSVSQPVAWLMSAGNLRGDTLKQQGITITLGVTSCCMS